MIATISALKSFPETLEQFFKAVPESYLTWEPENWDGIPSESLTAIEQLCHMRDIEIDGYHVRFRRLIEEENPILDSVDGYALVKERRYAEADPAEVLAAFRAARGQTLELIHSFNETQLKRTGIFDGYGHITVKGLIHFLSSHDQQHLAGIQWLLGKIESPIE